MGRFFAELKRRHIYRVAAAYAVVAWVLLQLVNNVAPVLDLPPWVARAFLLLLVIGLPITLLIAWTRELASADASTPATTKLDYVIAGGLLVVIALISYQQLGTPRGTNAPREQHAASAPVATAGGISIAVLPFTNLSGDANQEFFSDGMTEEITSALAKIPSLQVVARTSAFEYKGQNRNIQTIGEQLHTRYLIEGSVRKEGTRVRITAQLVQADNGVSMWTDSYDRELTSVFATQEEIAQAIAGALRVPLGLQPGENLVNNRSIDPESYEQYLRARALFNNTSATQGLKLLGEAASLLESVVARNPGYAPAWARLALVYFRSPPPSGPVMATGTAVQFRAVVDGFLQKADAAARRAIQLDPSEADAYVALALMQRAGGKFVEAEDLFKQALVLDPDNPDALLAYADQLGGVGRLKEALAMLQRLRALEPLVFAHSGRIASLLWLNGESEAAIDLGKAGGRGVGAANLAEIYASVGRYREAADTLMAIEPNIFAPEQVETAVRLLRSAPQKVPSPQALPALSYLGFVYLYVGAPDRMLEAFERDVEAGFQFPNVTGHLWHPVYAPVRKTERFKAYLRNAGLYDYWRARGWPPFCRPMGADDFVCD